MSLLRHLIAKTCIVVAMLFITHDPVYAQAMSGREIGTHRVHIAFYKVPPGRQDEWLALYKKYHQPIMDFQIKQGVTLSSTLFAPQYHMSGKSWDFVIINISPPEGQGPKLGMTRAQVLHKLFPDIDDYVRGERQRWALTLECEENGLVEIDVTRDPLSLYYPLDPVEPKK